MRLALVRSMKCYRREQGADQQLEARRPRRHATPQRLVSFASPRQVLAAESLLSTFGAALRRGEGGLPIVEHGHEYGCDADWGMP